MSRFPGRGGEFLQSQSFDEEGRGLLRRVIEGQAYRQLMLANIRGHGIKFAPEVEEKLALVRDLDAALLQIREIERLYTRLGFGDVVSAVRGKMERVPYPGTRLELAMCLFLCERVAWHASSAYVDCVQRDFAALARTRLDEGPAPDLPKDPAFVEFCRDATNRPLAQQLFNRWIAVTLLALGRPDSAGDARAVALGLRDKRVAEITSAYLASLAPFLRACQLTLPDAAALGVDLPRAASNPSHARGAIAR
jgi:1,2-phenylacetyl-CoA epoxidase catalytic subunit